MTSRIDIFDGVGREETYEALRQAIAQINRYKHGIEVRNSKKPQEFVRELLSRVDHSRGRYNVEQMMDVTFRNRYFKEPSKKIILLDESLENNEGMTEFGLSGGWEGRETAIISPRNLTLEQFYAVCCHELGHMYKATHRNHRITQNDGRHCVDKSCAMHIPAFNEKTYEKMIKNLEMYCKDCQQGIIVGKGTHNELLKNNPYYQKLWKQSKKI